VPGLLKDGRFQVISSQRQPTDQTRRNRARTPLTGQSVTEFALIMPFLLLLVLAIGDFARWYSTAITIESAAREAADYGAFTAERWQGTPGDPNSNYAKTVVEMERRVCTAAGSLSGYSGDPVGSDPMDCANPLMTYNLEIPPGITDCSINANDPPCRVKVTVTYDFDLFIPIPVVTSSFTFSRDSTYAVSPFPAS